MKMMRKLNLYFIMKCMLVMIAIVVGIAGCGKNSNLITNDIPFGDSTLTIDLPFLIKPESARKQKKDFGYMYASSGNNDYLKVELGKLSYDQRLLANIDKERFLEENTKMMVSSLESMLISQGFALNRKTTRIDGNAAQIVEAIGKSYEIEKKRTTVFVLRDNDFWIVSFEYAPSVKQTKDEVEDAIDSMRFH